MNKHARRVGATLLVFLLLFVSLVTPSLADDWTTFSKNDYRQGYVDDPTMSLPVKENWQGFLGPSSTQPLVVNKNIYYQAGANFYEISEDKLQPNLKYGWFGPSPNYGDVSTLQEQLNGSNYDANSSLDPIVHITKGFAFNPNDWTQFGRINKSSPTYSSDNNAIYIGDTAWRATTAYGSFTGRIKVYDKSLTKLGEGDIGAQYGYIETNPLVLPNDTVIVGTSKGYLLAIQGMLSGHTTVKYLPLGGVITGAITKVNNDTFVVAEDGTGIIAKIQYSNGSLTVLKSFQAQHGVPTSVLYSTDPKTSGLYFSDSFGYFYKLDENLNLIWTNSDSDHAGGFVNDSPSMYPGGVVVFPERALNSSYNPQHGGIFAIDPNTGKEKWAQFTNSNINNNPVSFNSNAVVVGEMDGSLQALHSSDGSYFSDFFQDPKGNPSAALQPVANSTSLSDPRWQYLGVASEITIADHNLLFGESQSDGTGTLYGYSTSTPVDFNISKPVITQTDTNGTQHTYYSGGTFSPGFAYFGNSEIEANSYNTDGIQGYNLIPGVPAKVQVQVGYSGVWPSDWDGNATIRAVYQGAGGQEDVPVTLSKPTDPSGTQTLTLNVLPSTMPGDRLVIQFNPNNDPNESDNNGIMGDRNNTITIPIQVAQPNLAIKQLSIDSSLSSKTQMYFDAIIQNDNSFGWNKDIQSYVDWSVNGSLRPRISPKNFPASQSTNVVLGPIDVGGMSQLKLGVCVNSNHDQPTNEKLWSDNCMTKQIQISNNLNLIANSMTTTMNPTLPGATVTTNVTVSSSSDSDPTQFPTAPTYVVLKDSAGKVLGKSPTNIIFTKPGEQKVVPITWQVPNATGVYFLFATINPDQTIVESTYTDNTIKGDVTVKKSLSSIQGCGDVGVGPYNSASTWAPTQSDIDEYISGYDQWGNPIWSSYTDTYYYQHSFSMTIDSITAQNANIKGVDMTTNPITLPAGTGFSFKAHTHYSGLTIYDASNYRGAGFAEGPSEPRTPRVQGASEVDAIFLLEDGRQVTVPMVPSEGPNSGLYPYDNVWTLPDVWLNHDGSLYYPTATTSDGNPLLQDPNAGMDGGNNVYTPFNAQKGSVFTVVVVGKGAGTIPGDPNADPNGPLGACPSVPVTVGESVLGSFMIRTVDPNTPFPSGTVPYNFSGHTDLFGQITDWWSGKSVLPWTYDFWTGPTDRTSLQ